MFYSYVAFSQTYCSFSQVCTLSFYFIATKYCVFMTNMFCFLSDSGIFTFHNIFADYL